MGSDIRKWMRLVEDRVEQQRARYPQIDADTLALLTNTDPTKEKFYLRWLARLCAGGKLSIYGSSLSRAKQALLKFHRAKLRGALPENARDILRYPDLQTLEQTVSELPVVIPGNKISWTYQLEWKQRAELSFVIVHCKSNARIDLDMRIRLRPSWLDWGLEDDNYDALRRLRKATQGRTGLMTPIVGAIHEVLGIYLAEQRPYDVAIQGFDEKRKRLYRSWTSWTFPNYVGKEHPGGVVFVRSQ